MLRKLFLLAIVAAVIGAGVFWFVTIPATVPASALSAHTPDQANGKTIFHAGGCASCHATPGQDDKTRLGSMPAFGRDGMMKRADIETVADYVRSIAGLPVEPKTDLAAGKKIFADTCASCHGDTGKGKQDVGAPNLTDAIWLYGADRAVIVDGLWNGRAGVMPAWAARLDDSTIKSLAVYVHTLGGGEK